MNKESENVKTARDRVVKSSKSSGWLSDSLTHHKLSQICKDYCQAFDKYNSTLKHDDLLRCHELAKDIKNAF